MSEPPPVVQSLDHLILTVRDVDRACAFYERALGMRRETLGVGRTALHFGRQKINLQPHPTPHAPTPHALVAEVAVPGSADLCFLTETPLARMKAHLEACGVAVIEGPVERSGAEGPILSLYCRDPDGNLVEIANKLQ